MESITDEGVRRRIERGIILAATQKPFKIGDAYVVSGWFCDGRSCACPVFEFNHGELCKHCYAGAVWEAHEHTKGVA
jgi:hypothetical protein